jgi:hypothetical protein
LGERAAERARIQQGPIDYELAKRRVYEEEEQARLSMELKNRHPLFEVSASCDQQL